MRKKLLKNLYYVSIFLLGITSTIWAHIAQIIVGLTYPPRDTESIMSGIFASMPYNIIALAVFIGSLIYIILYSRKQAKEEEKAEKTKNEMMKQAIKDGIKEAIAELKTTTSGGQDGKPKPTEPTK